MSGPQIQKWDPEWLVRRGNYLALITPDIAAELLLRNQNNRKPKRRAIAAYAADMLKGAWNPDASDIKFARNGDLIDGQNRLMACIEAGVPFPTLVRTGLATEARDHVDQGVRRTAGDTLRMAGLADANHIAAAINIRARYEKTVADGGRQVMSYAIGRRVSMTHAETLEYLAQHPTLEKYAKLSHNMQNVGPGVPRSVYIAAVSMFAESSEHMARQFVEEFIEGKSSGTGDPKLALMRYLAKAKSPAELRAKNRNRNLQHLNAFIRAWNAFIKSESLEKITVRDSDLFEPAV